MTNALTGDAPRLAFDIGGTFTDIVIVQSDGSITTDKVLSTSNVLEAAVQHGVEAALDRSVHSQISALLHATTVASNALLEKTGPPVGLLTTEGFRDELEIRRGARPSVYDFDWERTPPLIPRRLRFEVPERITSAGEVRQPLDLDATQRALEKLRAHGIAALAICFFNSYANPEHEQLAAGLAREMLPGVLVCTSHEVLPQPREYERMSTTSVNAYLMPVVHTYLDRVRQRFGSYCHTFRIMRSNGGLMTVEHAQRSPIHMVESGPAAGVLAAAALCREVGLDQAVSVDMGGTTVKASLIEGGAVEERADYEVGGESHMSARYSHGSGYTIAVPSFDIVEAGAGGGSIARIEDGVLRVGPISAGADPGPAAYCNGGTLPTVTDANIVLGFINPTRIAGGTLRVDRDAAAAAIDAELRPQLRLDTRDIAHGIREVANASMLRSIRAVTSEKGRDPRQYVMIAFGGSGPVHAASLAEMAGIRKVYIPPLPGLFSAVGLLLADMRHDYVRAVGRPLEGASVGDHIAAAFAGLAEAARTQAGAEGIAGSALYFQHLVDVRYAGQSYETTIEVQPPFESAQSVPTITEQFHFEHERRYGYRRQHEPVHLMTVRLRSWSPAMSVSLQAIGRAWLQTAPSSADSSRPIYFGPEHGETHAAVIDRKRVSVDPCEGPVIIEEPSTTVVVPPKWRATLDEYGNLLLENQ
jgi:N-methylhydantoinase A